MSIIKEAQAHLEGVTLSKHEEKTRVSMKRREAKDLYTQGWTAANGNVHIYFLHSIHIYVYAYTFIYIYVYIYMCIYIHMYIYIWVCIYIYICIYIYMYIYIYKYTYIKTCILKVGLLQTVRNITLVLTLNLYLCIYLRHIQIFLYALTHAKRYTSIFVFITCILYLRVYL
jgi:hypothetical protein